MVYRAELKYRYDKYIDEFAQANVIASGGESIDEPTKKAIQDEEFGLDIRNVSVNGSDNLLLSNDNRRAGIRSLPPDLLNWLPIKLTDVLKVNVCADHEELWWYTHDFTRAFSEVYGLFPEGLVDNFELLIRLVLSNPPSGFTPEQIRHSKILWEAKTLAAYLSYPTLEGFVKVACRHDIAMDGKIKDGKRIRKLTSPEQRVFQYHDDGQGICSNIGMLLWHLETEVAMSKNRVLLEEMREQIGDIFDHPPHRIYGLLNDFRNDSLHGRNQAPREYGVLLNYICLIIWITLN